MKRTEMKMVDGCLALLMQVEDMGAKIWVHVLRTIDEF
jgi:hypothetical protein